MALLALLQGCTGNYGDGGALTSAANTTVGSSAASDKDFVAKSVTPHLGFCRSCHVPGAVADTDAGRKFMLSADAAQDYDNLSISWVRLDKGVTTNKLLTKPSDKAQGHAAGQPWPVDSAPYVAMKLLLSCWDNPASCSALTGDAVPVVERPLLGSMHGGHAWFDYCATGGINGTALSDSAILPADPRSLVRAGANKDKAVYYNAFWKDCHLDPALVGEPVEAKTCGELRKMRADGERLIKGNGAIGAGSYFAGNSGAGEISATDYNNLWQKWGLAARPDNFDQLVAERYGMSVGAERNPYPLPGENVALTNGGSGQLPTGLTQLRTADGGYTGMFGTTCHVCHSGQAGTAADGPGLGALYGNGNNLSEYGQIAQDLGGQSGFSSPSPLVLGRTRGTNNALALQIITFVLSQDVRPTDPNFLGFAAFAPSGGSLDAPAWWNVGHRPVKFQDGFLAMDALRSDLGFFLPGPGPGGFDWIKAHGRAADTYLMSLKSPAFPYAYCTGKDGAVAQGDSARCINPKLAEQGAILFHSKNLWASDLQNPVAKPDGGNGSCASCHGAYSPRYVYDTAYLETPALEGIASYIVPRDLIGTDPARVDSDNEAGEQYGKQNFFAYPETLNAKPELDCSTQNRAEIRGARKPGYLAPPLYGVWASAPYFHNGAVPNVWEVLKPADRKPIWRRVSTPTRADQAGKVVMGYDTNLQRAYDADKLGWKYDALQCGATPLTPYLYCNLQAADPPLQTFLNSAYGNNPYLWYLGVTPLTNQQLEDRKIYNTTQYSQGNQGHAFTSVLNDAERKAIVEYLKTL